MHCPDCGAYVGAEDAFCAECGRPLSPEAAPDEDASPSEILESPARPPSPAPVKRSSPARLLILVGLALIVLCLCAGGALIWWTTDREPELGDVLYEEDFEDPVTGWTISSDDDTSVGYTDGQYRIAIYSQEYMAWGNPEPGLELASFTLEVDARQVDGPLDNNFGLVFRLQEDVKDFYWFQISGDGYYSVDRSQEDNWSSILPWKESDAVNQGVGATNHMRITCSGDQCSLYVNGTHLADMADDALSGGSIGLAAGAFEEPGVIVHFDNLKAYTVRE
ncbi:MAG: hypothetical protein P8189_00865 [Anaerolineae bacterium]|jgi:hypothetical protein